MTDATNSLGEGFSRLMTNCADRAEKVFTAFLEGGKEVVRLDVSHIEYSNLPEEQLRCRSSAIKRSLVIAAIAIAIIIAVSVIPGSGNGMGYSIIGMASLVALTHLKESFIEHLSRKKELEAFVEQGGDVNDPHIDFTFQDLMHVYKNDFVNSLGLSDDDASPKEQT